VADKLTREQRSWNMSRIRARDTEPERMVRSLLRSMGYRVEVYPPLLPGKPDMVLPRRRTAIFVHGCFWHRHGQCRYAYQPKSNRAFWNRKFMANVARDGKVLAELRTLGWRTIVVWECQVERLGRLKRRLRKLLSAKAASP